MSPLPDALLPRLRAGDVAAFEALFRDAHPALVAFGARYVGDAARAEELVQELFLTLWAERASLRIQGSVRAYLFGALRNRALNLRRRDAVERDWAAEAAHDDALHLHAPSPRADAALDAAERRATLDAALDALPERCALVMHLRWRERLSHAEIAQVMGISVKGVEIQLTRGLRALRATLGAPNTH